MYEMWVHTPDERERTAILAELGAGWRFSKLVIRRVENQVTEAIVTMPYQAGIVGLFPLDTRLEFYDDAGRLEGQTQWFVRVPPALVYDASGALWVEVRAACALYLLAGRIVAYAAGSPQAAKSGPADDLIKALVRENLGGLAAPDRDLSAYLDVAGDVGQGATVHTTMPRRNVLFVCQELARASAQAGKPLFFDIVWTGARLEFRTYLGKRGADHGAESAAPIVLSPEFGTLSNASRSFDHRDEATVVYCAGPGRGAERLIVSVSDDARRTMTPFNRRETFVDARFLSVVERVATEADAVLWRRRPVQQLGGRFEDTATWQYGRDWGWGDLTVGEFDGEVLSVRVHAVTIVVEHGARVVTGELRADSTEADDAVRRIEGRLDQTAADELPIFSVTPAAGAVPLALPSGFVDDGWLAASVARTLELAAETTARVAADADLASGLAAEISARQNADTGLASSLAAEISARQNADTGLASSLAAEISARQNADSAHAALTTGAHGGIVASGEVSATPAASAIPRAGVGGTLADGWLGAAIARVAQLTWANLSGRPATLVALTSPLTAASWNGAAKGAGTITINVNTEFGVPSGAKAVALRFTATWATVGANASIRPFQAATGVLAVRCQVANQPNDGFGIVALNANGLDIVLSAATSLTIVTIGGYWI